MEDKMLKELLYHVTNNTGPFLMITGIFGLVVMILLLKFGIINKFQEKIDQIGGINRFKITPIDLGQDPTNLTLTIAVQIKNIGFNESNLTNWSLALITEDKEKIIGTPCYSMDKITITMGDKKTYTFPKLYENSNVILEAGKSIVGAIQFNINYSPQRIFNEQFVIILAAEDNRGKNLQFKIPKKSIQTPRELIAELHDIAKNAI
jgi:hypothetical protein